MNKAKEPTLEQAYHSGKESRRASLQAELATLRTSLEKARDALRPFAAVANDRSLGLSKECFDRASAVLKEISKDL